MKIYAPVKDFDGLRNNVRFVRGVGETDNPNLIDWFESHGYKVALEDKNVKPVINPVISVVNDQIDEIKNEIAEDKSTLDFEAMTSIELRDYMRANGYASKIKNTRNKEKLLEILRG